jgi:glycogen operon protein
MPYSEHADCVELLLFDKHDDLQPVHVQYTNKVGDPTDSEKIESSVKRSQGIEVIEAARIPLTKTFHFWHVYVRDLKPGVHYAYRIGGPFDISKGYVLIERKF